MGLLRKLISRKKELSDTQKTELKTLEKKVGSLSSPHIGAARNYLEFIRKLESRNYDISNYENTISIISGVAGDNI